MSDDAAIRRENLRGLKKTPAELRAIGGGAYSYWRDLLQDPNKSFGEKAARNIETKLNLPRGWLDTPRGQVHELREEPVASPYQPAITLAQALPLVLEAITRLPPARWASVRAQLDQLAAHPEMQGDVLDELLPLLTPAASAGKRTGT